MDLLWDTVFWPAMLAAVGYIWKLVMDGRNHRIDMERERRAEKREVMRAYLTSLERLLNHHVIDTDAGRAEQILTVKAHLNELYLRAKPETVAKMRALFAALTTYSNWQDNLRNGTLDPDPAHEETLCKSLNASLLAAINAARSEFGSEKPLMDDNMVELIYLSGTSRSLTPQ